MLFAMLTCAAAAIDRRVRVNHGHEPEVYTNMFTLLYGPAGGRKSSAINRAEMLLREACPDTPVLPDDFSMSALLSDLSGAAEHRGKSTGMIISHELSDLIGGAEYRLENTRILAKLWDCPEYYERKTHAQGEQILRHVYVCHMAASSPDWAEQMDPKTMGGGWARREMIVSEQGAKRVNASPGHDEILFQALAKTMAARLGKGAFGGVDMELDREAEALNVEWYVETLVPWASKLGEKERQFIDTMQAHAFKVGAVVHLLEGGAPDTLSKDSLLIGQRLVSALVPGTFQVYASFAPSAFARLRGVIMRTVRSAGGALEEKAVDRAAIVATGAKPLDVHVAKISLMEEGCLGKEGTRLVVVG